LGELADSVSDVIDDLPYVYKLDKKDGSGEINSKFYWGVETKASGSVLARLARYPAMTGSDTAFSLKFVSGNANHNFTYNTSNPTASKKSPSTADGHTTLAPKHAKFTLPFAFGWDGWNKHTEPDKVLQDETELLTITQIGVQAIRQAVDIVSDPDFIDINLLAIYKRKESWL
jgi:hypothetical protein